MWSSTFAQLTPTVLRNRMRIARNLCLYHRRSDPDCFVPGLADFPRPHQPQRPHLFTEQQIVRLLQAADALRPASTSPLHGPGLRLAIVLLYTSGIRRGELVRLTLDDYDVRDRLLRIRDTKFNKAHIGDCCNADNQITWAISILPMLEQTNLQNQYNFNKTIEDPANMLVLQQPLTVYNCPDDQFAGPKATPRAGNPIGAPPAGQWSRSSYAGVSGVNWDTTTGLPSNGSVVGQWGNSSVVLNNGPSQLRGMLHWVGASLLTSPPLQGKYNPVRIRDVTDGTSNTLFVGEVATTKPDLTNIGSHRAPFWGFSYPGFIQSGIVPSNLSFVNGYDVCRGTPGQTKPVCQSVWTSQHGAVNFLMVDGSVRGISPNIDTAQTWVALGTISGGEVVGEF